MMTRVEVTLDAQQQKALQVTYLDAEGKPDATEKPFVMKPGSFAAPYVHTHRKLLIEEVDIPVEV